MTTLLSRRLFLRKAASTLPAVVVTAVPTVTAIAAEVVDPIAAMGPEVDQAKNAVQAAQAALEKAVATFEAICPMPSKELIAEPTSWLRSFAVDEVDARYNRRIRQGEMTPLRIAHSQPMRDRLDRLDKRTIEARGLKRLIPIAEAYEAAFEAARETSGMDAVESDLSLAEWQVESVIATMSETAATSLAGVGVKAQAILAFAELGPDLAFRARNNISTPLAEDVAALARGVPRATYSFDAAQWVGEMLALGRQLTVVDGRLRDMDPTGPYPPGGKNRVIALYRQRDAAPNGRALVIAECIRRDLIDGEYAA
jgi:hypothetical protein